MHQGCSSFCAQKQTNTKHNLRAGILTSFHSSLPPQNFFCRNKNNNQKKHVKNTFLLFFNVKTKKPSWQIFGFRGGLSQKKVYLWASTPPPSQHCHRYPPTAPTLPRLIWMPLSDFRSPYWPATKLRKASCEWTSHIFGRHTDLQLI